MNTSKVCRTTDPCYLDSCKYCKTAKIGQRAAIGANNPNQAPLPPKTIVQVQIERLQEQVEKLTKGDVSHLYSAQADFNYRLEKLEKADKERQMIALDFQAAEIKRMQDRLDTLEKNDEMQDEVLGNIEDLIEFDIKRRLCNLEAKSEVVPPLKDLSTQTPKSDESYLSPEMDNLLTSIIQNTEALRVEKEAFHPKKSEPTYCCESMSDEIENTNITHNGFGLSIAGIAGKYMKYCPFCGSKVSK